MATPRSELSKDIEVTGTMKFQGELIFEGKFNGDLIQGNSLVVGEHAEVHAKSIIVDNLSMATPGRGNAFPPRAPPRLLPRAGHVAHLGKVDAGQGSGKLPQHPGPAQDARGVFSICSREARDLQTALASRHQRRILPHPKKNVPDRCIRIVPAGVRPPNLSLPPPLSITAMLDESLQEQAALYAVGALSAPEREQFDLILKFHTELRALVVALEEVAAAALTSSLSASSPGPSASLRGRLLARLDAHPQQTSEEGFVMTGPDGLVQWINPAFTAMCGYTLDELHGKKLGPILQGRDTDHGSADRMRRAVYESRPCTETILNYHKNGQPYWVEIAITPILDDAGAMRWFVARGREVPDQMAA